MCPLRLILILLSATLAGLFVLKNLKSQHETPEDRSNDSVNAPSDSTPLAPHTSVNKSSQVWAAIEAGFWTCVDMASGRYLWRNLVSCSSAKRSS